MEPLPPPCTQQPSSSRTWALATKVGQPHPKGQRAGAGRPLSASLASAFLGPKMGVGWAGRLRGPHTLYPRCTFQGRPLAFPKQNPLLSTLKCFNLHSSSPGGPWGGREARRRAIKQLTAWGTGRPAQEMGGATQSYHQVPVPSQTSQGRHYHPRCHHRAHTANQEQGSMHLARNQSSQVNLTHPVLQPSP